MTPARATRDRVEIAVHVIALERQRQRLEDAIESADEDSLHPEVVSYLRHQLSRVRQELREIVL